MRQQTLRSEAVIHYHQAAIPQNARSLTRWIGPQNQGDRQPLDFRFPVGGEGPEEPIGGHSVIPIKHADNLLHVPTVLEKRMSVERYDESLNLGEFDTPKRFLEWGRNRAVRACYQ